MLVILGLSNLVGRTCGLRESGFFLPNSIFHFNFVVRWFLRHVIFFPNSIFHFNFVVQWFLCYFFVLFNYCYYYYYVGASWRPFCTLWWHRSSFYSLLICVGKTNMLICYRILWVTFKIREFTWIIVFYQCRGRHEWTVFGRSYHHS